MPSLFGALQDIRLIYLATRPTRFEAARKTFLSMVDRPLKVDPGDEVVRYFRVRKFWETKQYEKLTDADIQFLNQSTQRFAKHSCQERYASWRDGQISDGFVKSQFHDLAPQKIVKFEAELVDGQASLFESQTQSSKARKPRDTLKTATEAAFRSDFSSAFATEKEKP